MTYYKHKRQAFQKIEETVKECYEKGVELDAIKLYYALIMTGGLQIGKGVVKEGLQLAKTKYPLADIAREDEL